MNSSGIQLVDSQSFARYAEGVAQHMMLKQQQLTAFAGDDHWFDKIKSRHESSEFQLVGQVAVIPVCGMLAWEYDFWMWLMDGCSYCGIMNKVRAAADDTRVTKIILQVNSPGGGSTGCLEASNAIFEARSKKQIVAVVDPLAASAGYWLASQANKIVCMESGWVGSVGTESDYRSLSRMMTEAGIDWAIIRSKVSPDKNLGHAYEPISDEAKAYIQEMCDYAAVDFIAHVARGRGIKDQQVIDSYGKGRMLFGRQALGAKMVDAIGDMRSELAESGTTPSRTGTTAQRTRAAADTSLFTR